MRKTVEIDGQTYCVGLNGKTFVRRQGEWRRSHNFSAGEVRNAIQMQEHALAAAEKANRERDNVKAH